MTVRPGIQLAAVALICLAASPPAGSERGGGASAELESATRFSAADYAQSRRIPGLDRPLASSGTVTITADGFIWSQQAPFANTLSFDGARITETTRTGDRVLTRPLNDPATVSMTRTLYSMLRGSWTELEESFQIVPLTAPEGRAWALRLIPRDDAVRAVIPEIRVAGGQFLEEIGVHQHPDGQTRIILSNHRRQP